MPNQQYYCRSCGVFAFSGRGINPAAVRCTECLLKDVRQQQRNPTGFWTRFRTWLGFWLVGE